MTITGAFGTLIDLVTGRPRQPVRAPNKQLSGGVAVRLSARLGLMADAQGLTEHTKP